MTVVLPPHIKHGGATAYSNYNCRCNPCRQYRSEVARKFRARHLERLRAERRARYHKDPARAGVAVRKRVDRKRAIVSRYKVLKGCVKCGYREHAAALDLHHRDPAQKKVNISHAMGFAWPKLKEEIFKCEVICRNCHNVLHYGGSA